MKTFLAIDFGSGTLKLAEFEARTDGTLLLHRYFLMPMEGPPEPEGDDEEPDPFASVNHTLTKVLDENEIRAKGMEANYCISSSQVFAKLLRTPPVEGSKVSQIIMYEAQQNVPFPLEEVQWDYQVLGTAETGELDVLLMALRSEVVEGFADLSRKHGMKLQIIDGSAAALRNAYMHNYGEPEDCVLLLDIGAKTTNALFIEGSMFYTRSINIGSQNITSEFAKEAQLDEASAERYKCEYGYVHLGGSYEDSQDPHQAIVSKVARNVLTRLHQQVAQTIQFYRSQQGGTPPTKIYLAGSGSQLAYTANFFQQKLNLDVEYFNPFKNIELAEGVNREELARTAHALGELVGSGLRKVTMGMTEFNLLPAREKVSREIDRRAPYVVASVFCVALIFMIFGAYEMSLAKVKVRVTKQYSDNAPPDAMKIKGQLTEIQERLDDFKARKGDAEAIQGFLKSRYVWIHLLRSIKESIQQVEPYVKITAFFDAADKKQILRMDQYPGLVGTEISVLPWRAVHIEGASTLSLGGHMFQGGEAVQFRGRLPSGVANVTNTFYIGLFDDDGPTFTLHGKEEDAVTGENPVIFTEQEQRVGIGPITHPWAHHVYWHNHPLVKGNTVRFVGHAPTVPHSFRGDENQFYVKIDPNRPDAFALFADDEMKRRINFADRGVIGQFGIQSTDRADVIDPAPAQEEQEDASEVNPPDKRPKPLVDLTDQLIVWPGHGFKDRDKVGFDGAPTNWPKGLRVVNSETHFFVEPRGPDWVALHSGRLMDENTRVIFAGLSSDKGFVVKTVPGEFILDSPRGAGQGVNPKLVGEVAAALDTVVGLGGSYAVDSDTGEVIYVGLVGPSVPRDAVREPVLAQLTALKKLQYLDLWRDPSIARKDWPAFEDLLSGFKDKVRDCSISLALPTTVWVRSLEPQTEGEEGESQTIVGLTLKVRALNLKPYYTIANRDFAMMVVKTINGHPYFHDDPETEEGAALSEGMADVSTESLFFNFEINLPLSEPLKLGDLEGAGTLAGAASGGEEAPGDPPDNTGPQGNNKAF